MGNQAHREGGKGKGKRQRASLALENQQIIRLAREALAGGVLREYGAACRVEVGPGEEPVMVSCSDRSSLAPGVEVGVTRNKVDTYDAWL
jgi:hypothetical protein